MTGIKSYLTNSRVLIPPVKVMTANLGVMEASICGDVVLSSNLILNNVLFIPTLRYNIISSRQLTNLGHTIVLNPNGGILYPNDEQNIDGCHWEIKYSDGIMYLNTSMISGRCFVSTAALHYRLGHIPLRRLRENFTRKLDAAFPFCYASGEAGLTTASSKSMHDKASSTRSGQLIHADLVELPRGYNGDAFVLTVLDDKSRKLWVFTISRKSQVTSLLMNLIKSNDILRTRLYLLKTDGGQEFRSNQLKDFLDKMGISHQLGRPYQHNDNGAIERANRTVVRTTRLLLSHSNLSISLWPCDPLCC